MRALIQKVRSASVEIAGETVSQISQGYLILLGVRNGDTLDEVNFLAEKCQVLRIFEDEEGKLNRSIQDVGGSMLVVSQFTLYADARKGRRPAFVDAAPRPVSEPLYEAFVQKLRSAGIHVETGRFGADMQVHLVNDGPTTILLEKEHAPLYTTSAP